MTTNQSTETTGRHTFRVTESTSHWGDTTYTVEYGETRAIGTYWTGHVSGGWASVERATEVGRTEIARRADADITRAANAAMDREAHRRYAADDAWFLSGEER